MTEPVGVSCDWADDTAPFGVDEAPDIDPDVLDSVIANELAQLTMSDREKLLCEIHGVPSKIRETPQMIEESLHMLHKEITNTKSKDAYQQALELNPAFVEDPKFQLKFLRSERFDHLEAAKRLIKFFEWKSELFDPSLLATNITQDHLDDEDLDGLYNGMGMDLPFRDRAGRLVYFQLAQPVNVPVRAILRKSFYSLMSFTDDEETQKNGFVIVSYIVGQQLPWSQMRQRREMNRQWGKLLATVPIRLDVLHVCMDSILWRPILAAFKLACKMCTRIRVREHIGDHKQAICSLQALGIPTYGFPVAEDGTILRHLCTERWKKRHMQEQMMQLLTRLHSQDQKLNSNDQILNHMLGGTPGQNDVLLGRGKLYYSHPGNLPLKRIVMARLVLYEEAGYAEKYKVSADVVEFIKSQSGRFLRDDGNGWVEVDDETAIKKVSHGFRTLRGIKNGTAVATTKCQSVKQSANDRVDYT